MTSNQPSMNSMVVGGYKNADATNLRRGYWEPSIVTTQIPDHRKTKSVANWEKEEWLKKLMVETIWQIQKTQT
jgi:hypothetical protein